ncbi:MAG: protein kinase, partial [Myxococcota bacterium]
GIVHRDLKPENIFLVEREGAPHFVKLLDFGISKLDFASKISSKGNVMGTPHYMSPEQANGFELDGRTDLYALGVVLYVMLSGQLPFGADSMPALMMKIVAERPAELTRVNTHVSAALSAIVDRLLAKRPEDRYQSAAETLEALDAAVHSPEMAPKEAVLTAVSSTRPSRPIMLALGFTALAAAGWVLWPTAGDDAAVESPPQRSQATQTRSAEATDPRDASAEATDTNAPERSGAPSESEGAPIAESPTAGAQANAAAERRAPRRVVWMRPDPAEAAAETNVESSEPDGPNETPEPSPPEPSPPEPASPPAGLKTISI